MKYRNTVLIGTATAIGLIAGLVYTRDALAHYEEPNFEVLSRDGKFEVRRYPALISAEVVVPDGSQAENDAFKILAGYIFGRNRKREKVAMTIPVTMERTRIAMTTPVTIENLDSEMRMRFFMPSKYNLETLPTPLDTRIEFNEVPQADFAVIRFSGFLTRDRALKHESLLREMMLEKDLLPAGTALTSAYNPPWTLPFLRRNEVWIPIKLKH